MSEFKKNVKWAVLFLTVIGISLLVLMIHKNTGSEAKTAKIIQDGAVIRTVDLENVMGPYEFTITNEHGGENTVRVEEGKIAVIHANCPDKICVKRGFIEDGTFPIVCLPNKLSVMIENSKADIDAVSGGDAQ